jgi:hypothetical protein
MTYLGLYQRRMSMSEFANLMKQRAKDAMGRIYGQEATPGMNPVLELIVALLEDGAGGVLARMEMPVTTEQWLTWNQLALERQEDLVQTVKEVLEEEEMELPSEHEEMRSWAACLLLSTLARMEMQ